MVIFGNILAVILVTILISSLFYYAFRARGPWRSFWYLYLVLLLVIWVANLWIRPIGPVYWGVAWVPLFFVGLIFALLLAAIPTPDHYEDRNIRKSGQTNLSPEEIERRKEINATAAAVGGFFWVLLILLIMAILVGYAV